MFAQFWQLSTAAGTLTKSVILSEYTLPNIYIYNVLSLYNRHLTTEYFPRLFVILSNCSTNGLKN